MKGFILTLLIYASTVAMAQSSVLPSSYMPQVGETFTSQPVHIAGISEGGAGAHQTWDLRTIADSGSATTEFVLAPSATPYSSLYPGAAVALVTTDGTDTAYAYEGMTGGDVAALGNYMTIIGGGIYYHPARVFFHLPATYGDVYGHAFAGASDNGDTINGVDSFTVDGYGTLRLPQGDFTDVLRFRRTQHVSSTNTGFSYFVQLDQTEYAFYSLVYHDFLFDIQYTVNDVNGSVFAATTARYAKSVTTGLTGVEKESAISVFPNPTKDLIQIRMQESYESRLRLVDATGHIVQETGISGKTILSAAGLPDGIYLLVVTGATGTVTRVVVVER